MDFRVQNVTLYPHSSDTESVLKTTFIKMFSTSLIRTNPLRLYELLGLAVRYSVHHFRMHIS